MYETGHSNLELILLRTESMCIFKQNANLPSWVLCTYCAIDYAKFATFKTDRQIDRQKEIKMGEYTQRQNERQTERLDRFTSYKSMIARYIDRQIEEDKNGARID